MALGTVMTYLAAVSLPLWLVVEAFVPRGRNADERRVTVTAPTTAAPRAAAYAAAKPSAGRPLSVSAR